jgi:hypothetical protein
MAEFPQLENEILQFGERIAAGFRANPDVFPDPVVTPDQLEAQRAEFFQARKRADEARAAAKQATKHKKEVLQRYKSTLRDALRYAESVTSSDNRKLSLIGWGARRAGKRLQAPGQVLELRIEREGPGWIELSWEAPPKETGTGRVRFYEVQRSRLGKNEWTVAAGSADTSVRLDNQERGVEWEYRVIAANIVGRGKESNVVMAVL